MARVTRMPFLPQLIALLERHKHELCSSFYTRDDNTPTNHCLMGWMAKDEGIALPPTRFNTHVLGMKGTERFAAELQEAYDLTLGQLQQLQLANDDAFTVPEMIEQLIGLARSWSIDEYLAA